VLACIETEHSNHLGAKFDPPDRSGIFQKDPERLIEESCKKQRIQPDQLTLHADRGTSMRSKSVALLLADLGVTKTHSRPHVSDDNPYSETLAELWKYRLMKKIIHSDDALEEKKESVHQIPLSEHWHVLRKIKKDLKVIDKIAAAYGLENKTGELREEIAGRALLEWRPIMLSKYKGAREPLLIGRPSHEISSEIRSEDTAIQVGIYRALKSRLQSKATKKKGLFDIFLCQMAELIGAESNVQGLSDGETIRRANRRLPK
jgi:hypothetical protein